MTAAGYALRGLLALALLCALALAAAWAYLASDAPKTFREAAWLNGGSLEVRSLRLTDLADYPNVGLRATGVRLSDADFEPGRRDVLRIGELRLELLASPFADTLAAVERLTVRGGYFDLHTDEGGGSNLDRLRDHEGPAPGGDTPDRHSRFILAEDAEILLADFRFDLTNPDKGHDIGAHLDSLRVTDLRRGAGFGVSLYLDALVDGIQLDPGDGPYLERGRLRGGFDVSLDDRVLRAEAPALDIAGNRVDFSATYFPDRADTSVLRFAMASTRLTVARPLLTEKIRRAIAPYDVAGTFASVTTLRHTFREGDKPIVSVDLVLPGNDVEVQGTSFADSHVRGRFVNRLPGHDVHAVGYPRGVRFAIDTARTTLEGFDVRTGGALVSSPRGGPTLLRGPATIAGPASAASAVVGSEEFVFTEGTVRARTQLRGPTGDLTALIMGSDGEIAFDDAVVELPEAGVRLPIDSIHIAKRGAHADFTLGGATPGRDNPYLFSGELDNFEALLRVDAPNRVTSRVDFRSPRLEWRDALDLLGGRLDTASADAADVAIDSVAEAASKNTLKSVLRLVEATFDPELTIAVDTLAYYGFELHDFATGVDFEREGTLVRLERSRFRVDSGSVSFEGTLDISRPGETPFDFALEARRLDLAELLPEVDYFGQELLADVGPLPDDVDVTVFQRGSVDDVLGLLPNRSEGSIEVVSNGAQPFEASIDFEPDRPGQPDFNSAHVELSGSPTLFNGFFGTEDFFFEGGEFAFWLDYSGLVPDVRTLIDNEDMGLAVARAGVRFAELDAVLPVTRLDVAVSRDTGQVSIVVRNADIGQEVRVEGIARNVSEVVYGDTGERFSADVAVTSPRLVWSDLSALIGAFADESDTTADTATRVGPSEPLSLQRGLRSLMLEFNPRARLLIDTLQLSNSLVVDRVYGGLWMDADSVVHLDTTGFRYRGGAVEVAGVVDLADLAVSPFSAHLRTDALDVPGLLEGLGYLDSETLAALDRFEGELSAEASVSGVVTEAGEVWQNSLDGTLTLEVRDLAVAGLAPIDSLRSRVGLLEDRLAELEFAPVRTTLALDSGTLHIPFTELQTNAFGVWVEGDVDFDGEVDVWVTIPLENLFRDFDAVPPLRGEAVPRLRTHVQLAGSAGEGLTPKLRLSRRGLYRGQPGARRAWREARRRWRAARRASAQD